VPVLLLGRKILPCAFPIENGSLCVEISPPLGQNDGHPGADPFAESRGNLASIYSDLIGNRRPGGRSHFFYTSRQSASDDGIELKFKHTCITAPSQITFFMAECTKQNDLGSSLVFTSHLQKSEQAQRL